jgi:phage shock protein E
MALTVRELMNPETFTVKVADPADARCSDDGGQLDVGPLELPESASCLMRSLLLLCLVAAGCASDVSAREARRLVLHGALLVDVRSRSEFVERHADHAINIPVDELKHRTAELGARNRPIVVYCHTGVRSGIAVIMLRKAGITAVYNLGTIGRWFHEPDDPPTTIN